MRRHPRRLLVIILLLTLLSIIIDLPSTLPVNFSLGPVKTDFTINRPKLDITLAGKRFYRDLNIKRGLDLQGGTHLVLKADMSKIDSLNRQDALDSSKEIIARRVDLFGVSEPVIQTSIIDQDYRIIVELPGINNIDEAINLIGTTAQLDFREFIGDSLEASPSAIFTNFISTGLTGEHLTRATVQFDPNTGQPVVNLLFDDEGKKRFADITTRNIGKPVGIFLDEIPVTIPQVNEAITQGSAVISGDFTTKEAKNLSIQLNAGALPVPIEVISQRTIGASLGEESVTKSLRAGIIGLIMVMVFMALLYGWLGVLADLALLIYGLLTLAIYKLIPITLTLPGLAGFILSVGMAVDSNILIFERMKEEIRSGKPWQTAMELGFGRAWDSIKDANIATLTTAFILFNPLNWSFLNTSGMIRGFALTLSLGIIISLFTGIIVTRTLLRVLYRRKDK